jgi:hypothetical protein
VKQDGSHTNGNWSKGQIVDLYLSTLLKLTTRHGEATNDFPVATQVSKKHGTIFFVTNYDGTCIYEPHFGFVTAEHVAGSYCFHQHE